MYLCACAALCPGPLARVMGKMFYDVVSFIVIFACYLTGASIAFNITFGQEMYAFRDIPHSIVALARLMFGDGDYEAYVAAHSSLSRLFQLAFL